MSKAIKGIDVSKWQGKIDWEKVKESGIEFAIIRASYGTSGKDKCFEQNYFGAKNNGLPTGAYHYSYAKNEQQAVEEAKHFYSVIKGKVFEYPVVFDIEENDVAKLGRNKVSAIIKAFCSQMEEYGFYVTVYSNKSWLENYFTKEVFDKYDIWVAQWSDKCTFEKPYGIWQFSAKGSVNGINGDVDMNYSYKKYPDIMKKNGLNGFTKQATTETIAFKKGDKVKVSEPIGYDSGKKFKLYHDVYEVLEKPKGNRAVIGVDGVVTSAIHVKYLTKV